MIVNWKGDRVLSVPVLMARSSEQSSLKFSNPVGGEKLVRLIPGYNEIMEKDWEIVADLLQRYIDNGKLETFGKKERQDVEVEVVDSESGEVSKEVESVTKERGISIRRFTPKAAKDAVKGCFNLDTLNFWLTGSETYEAEVRDEIRVLIKEQVDQIQGGDAKAVGTTNR
jgi:hypothetical protein